VSRFCSRNAFDTALSVRTRAGRPVIETRTTDRNGDARPASVPFNKRGHDFLAIPKFMVRVIRRSAPVDRQGIRPRGRLRTWRAKAAHVAGGRFLRVVDMPDRFDEAADP
jgi:hypothetical protein